MDTHQHDDSPSFIHTMFETALRELRDRDAKHNRILEVLDFGDDIEPETKLDRIKSILHGKSDTKRKELDDSSSTQEQPVKKKAKHNHNLDIDLNLFLVDRTDNGGYDSYSSFIVACDTEQEARSTHPNGGLCIGVDHKGWSNKDDREHILTRRRDWINVDKIDTLTVEWIGRAKSSIQKGEVIMSEYHAG